MSSQCKPSSTLRSKKAEDLIQFLLSQNLPGWTQGGSDGTNILADFAVKYSKQAASLGVNLQEMYTALVSDAEVTPAT